MEKRQDKRAKTSVDDSLKEMAQNLPLLCVESILRFTPTSKLVRLYSKAVPLPGAFWNIAVQSVLQKRLPLSLGDDPPYHQAANPATIFDATGAKVANIKQPEAFRFSPLCELVSRTILSCRAVRAVIPTDGYRLYIAHGDTLLACLRKVTDVTLVVRELHIVPPIGESFALGKDLLEPNLKHLLPQLESFAVRSNVINTAIVEITLVNFMRSLPLGDLTCLRCLSLPNDLFDDVLQAAGNFPASRRVLSGLRSIVAYQKVRYRPGDLLRSVSTSYRQVSTLCLPVRGEFTAYLAAFRALPLLDCLGLHLLQIDLKGVTFGLRDTINSVSDLRLLCQEDSTYAILRKIAALFPLASSVALEHGESDRDALDLAFELFIKQASTAVQTLRCFFCGSRDFSVCSSEHITGFLLANQNLPEAVDLSPTSFVQVASNPDLLTVIYRAMQGNFTKVLLLRGPVHQDALSVLRSHVDLNDENARITAWKDRDLGQQRGLLNTSISPQTNMLIFGTKTAGSLKGERFTIRVVHQSSKQSRIFDFKLE